MNKETSDNMGGQRDLRNKCTASSVCQGCAFWNCKVEGTVEKIEKIKREGIKKSRWNSKWSAVAHDNFFSVQPNFSPIDDQATPFYSQTVTLLK